MTDADGLRAVRGVVASSAHDVVRPLFVDLRRLDARAWGDVALGFDAIVSDLPYGHSASVKGV